LKRAVIVIMVYGTLWGLPEKQTFKISLARRWVAMVWGLRAAIGKELCIMKQKPNPKIVIAAVIEKDGLILIARRKEGKQHAGKWEFPGGTLEEGETDEQCLRRELQEELAATAEVGDLFCSSEYRYTPDYTIRLLAYRATVSSDTFKLNDHEEVRWVKPTDLVDYDFPEADKPIVEKLIEIKRH
jgi:8-oxo-dGTP diphosphatase